MEKASTFMRELVIAVGGNLRPTENRKAWLYRVAEMSGLHYRVVRAAWHGEQLSFKAARKLKAATEKKIANENADTAARFEQIARSMEAADSELYWQEIDTYRELARQIRLLANGAE